MNQIQEMLFANNISSSWRQENGRRQIADVLLFLMYLCNIFMDSWKIVKLLPFAFAIHNIEEAWTIGSTGFISRNPLVANVNQFVIAVALFTVLGFVLVFGKKLYRNSRSYQYAMTGFSGMLFLNVFFPHVVSALFLRAYTSGLMSAVGLLLPLTGVILWGIFQSKVFFVREFLMAVFLGGLIGVILVAVFLGVGYVLT